jgi:hypothetical protein
VRPPVAYDGSCGLWSKAPAIVQVAARWHLLRNLSESLKLSDFCVAKRVLRLGGCGLRLSGAAAYRRIWNRTIRLHVPIRNGIDDPRVLSRSTRL